MNEAMTDIAVFVADHAIEITMGVVVLMVLATLFARAGDRPARSVSPQADTP